jgi:hypothetical protein
VNESKAVDGDDAAVDQVVPVADSFFFFFAVQSPAGEETGTMTAYTEQPP